MGNGVRRSGRGPFGLVGRLDLTGVHTQVAAGMVAVFALAVVGAALPTYAVIHAELVHQAWERLDRGAAASRALLAAEMARMADLARLAAQRPTLLALASGEEEADLQAYLEIFRRGAELDLVVVERPDGHVIATGVAEVVPVVVPSTGPPRILAIPGSGAGAAVVATSDILDETADRVYGQVTVVRLVDEEFLNELGLITGMRYSLLLGHDRVATTLPGFPVPVGSEPAADRLEFLAAGAPFYAVSTPLDAPAGLNLETALPLAEMQRQARQALRLLAATWVLAAGGVAFVGVLLGRRLARPIAALTDAARRIRQGDLDTPVPIPGGPKEIRALASMLEAGRLHTRDTVETLLHEKAWSEALIQAVVEGIVTLDQTRRIVTFSPGAERLIGWRASDAIGQAAANVFRTPDGAPFLDQLPPPGGRRPVQIVDRGGRNLTLSITDARYRLPSDGGERLALVMRDVSDDEAVRQLRSYFLANISHEFRTPLSAIHASVELLLEDLASLSKDDVAGLLHSVDLSVTGLQTLIDNLLESLSIEAGRFTIRRHMASLAGVVDQSVRVMRPLLDRREQSLRVELPDSPPPIWMDPMRVTQVIVNLLSNASKYSPVRSPIDLSVDRPDDHTVRVSVADRGEGIPPEDRENLFRRFVRLEPADPGQYGVGLGLSVVKAIVQEHGGKVGVDSRSGGGSIFWFTLPLQGGPS